MALKHLMEAGTCANVMLVLLFLHSALGFRKTRLDLSYMVTSDEKDDDIEQGL